MITPTTTSMTNPVGFRLMMFMVCVVLLVVNGEHQTTCIPKEREALLQFKAAIVDEHNLLSSWTTPDCCQWEGIRCSNVTAHVLGLHLPEQFRDESFLPGGRPFSRRRYIHESLMELRQLEYLNLSHNSFRDNDISGHQFVSEIFNSLGTFKSVSYVLPPGSHIPEFLGSLTNLKYLDLSSCDFGGKIPSQFGSLSHLKYLNLSWNSLKGSIPRQLGNLSRLRYLDLRHNLLEGNVPSQLGNLSQLQELYLTGNYFEGYIPSQLGNLSQLQKLYLGGDGIKIDDGGQGLSNLISLTHLYFDSVSNLNRSHSWLQVIAKLPKLRELSLVDCSLSNHFIMSSKPSHFNSSTSLSILDLSFNTFTSPMVFQWVSNITSNLVELDLSRNLLEGSTSSDFGMVMNSLRHLHLSYNYFKARDLKSFINICTLHSLNLNANGLTEDLPSILGNLSSGCARHSFQELDLNYNSITGTLPDISVFSSLKTLSLDINHLSGTIPEDVKLPSTLEGLSIKANFLEGGIPKSFGNACALRSLDMSYNSLSEEFPVIIRHLSGCSKNSLQELIFEGNKLKGTLPDLSIFSTLQVLKLSENELNGKIPKGSKLPSMLENFSIRSNRLEGGIAKLFGNARSLLSVDMFNNSFTDELPKVISHLSCARYSLEELDLGMNQINGTLPDFSTFTFLKRLNLSENKLNGEIPKDIQLPPQLEELYMDSNSLKGVLNDYHFANMSNLKELHLSDNSLALTFTKNWVPLFQLLTIELRSCKLGPTFPKWLQTQNKFSNIDISNAAISDIVPEWFWAKLPRQKVMKMNISYNNLRGILPKFPPTYIPTSMSFGSNQFEGSIPLFLRNSGRLDLSKNKLSSSLSFLCENGTLQGLSHLDLSYNWLSGHIPDCWRQLNSLVYLDLSHNNFSGKIPTSMGSLIHLQALLLRNNSLVEGIPFSLRNCRKLVMVDVSGNKLSGSIPDWIGTKRELQILILGRNQFFGSLPSRICCLRNIQLLDLSLNNLSGKIPKCIKNLTSMAQTTSLIYHGDHWYFFKNSIYATNMSYDLNALLTWKGSEQMFMNRGLSFLKSIDLSSNHFSEEIPLEIEKLSGLISLNLSRNNFTGKIPSNIGNLASLDSLDLSRNQLVGSIPLSLTQIYRLGVLDLSHNHLTGKIPTATQLQGFNPSSYEDNFNLCGPPLQKMCIEGRSTQEPNVEVHEDEYSLFNNDFFISMTFGFVLSFWMVFGTILFKSSW